MNKNFSLLFVSLVFFFFFYYYLLSILARVMRPKMIMYVFTMLALEPWSPRIQSRGVCV